MEKQLSEQEINEIENNSPHVVILGAGATMAAIPNGDRYGKPCSVMRGFIKNLHLEPILASVKLKTESENIEDIYSELFARGDECKAVRQELEDAIYDYFSKLELPDQLNIYDLILLSLTKKDCIATFNWDPFLIQAYNRVNKITDNLPQFAFLHGNVVAAHCPKCGRLGALQRGRCDRCGTEFQRFPLFYPVRHKDYNANPFIKREWEGITNYLSRCKMLTVFGYSAPKTDKEAVSLVKKAFEEYLPAQRFNRIEIIERPGFQWQEVSPTWVELINDSQCSYNIVTSFFDSSLAQSPRRTIECLHKRNNRWWGDTHITFSQNDIWETIKGRITPLLQEEKQDKRTLDVNPV